MGIRKWSVIIFQKHWLLQLQVSENSDSSVENRTVLNLKLKSEASSCSSAPQCTYSVTFQGEYQKLCCEKQGFRSSVFTGNWSVCSCGWTCRCSAFANCLIGISFCVTSEGQLPEPDFDKVLGSQVSEGRASIYRAMFTNMYKIILMY